MSHKKYIKYTAILVLLAFMITSGLPTQQLAYAKYLDEQAERINKVQKASYKKTFDKPVTETSLGSFADELYNMYEKLNADLDAGDLSKLKADLKEIKKSLGEIRKDISRELTENEKVLQKLNAKNASKRHLKFKTELDSKLNSFEAIFSKLDEISSQLKDLKGKESADLKSKIQEVGALLKPEEAHQSLGTLPHNNISVNPPDPATGTGISAAYMGNTTETAGQEYPKTPSAEDLAETAEVKFTKEIKELADSLNTPVKIYEYVKNNVNFETYYGSRKGAGGTLQQMAGNDLDQASLLISMLRYKGIPARYVKGTVDIPIEKVMKWT